MGLLTEGSPLSWDDTAKWANHVRQSGIQQFIEIYDSLKDRTGDVLRWGDEVEYFVVKFDEENKRAQLSLRAEELLKILQQKQEDSPDDHPTTWHPEYAAYMIEGTPGKPYGHRMAHFNLVEANMRRRRLEVQAVLKDDEVPLTLTSFPRLGCPAFTSPEAIPTPNAGASHSLFFPDEAIFDGHPRFKTLTKNIRSRRGKKVAINIPIFRDKDVAQPFQEKLSGDNEALPDHIYMDAMGFGMGCSCLQMTFQACNIEEARHLYDQLTPLTPIVLALSAASPIYRGFLSDVDCRWNVIAASVDDRTDEEQGLLPLKKNKFRIFKSRYDSIDSYLSPGSDMYNDMKVVKDEEFYSKLIEGGIDHLLAQHVAHLFIRDPISLFSEKIHSTFKCDTDHFENIQSTNWQTMRFKPPPPCSQIGWRVEFRPTEVQLTDFENAAFVVFVVLVTRVILTYKLDLRIPISKVDVNMKNAQKKDAVLNGKFYFRKDIRAGHKPCCYCKPPQPGMEGSTVEREGEEGEFSLYTVDEILNGKPGEFVGLLPLIKQYLDSIDDCDIDTMCTITQYLNLMKRRASGQLKTTAAWIRHFVMTHLDYKNDSQVTEKINFDLLKQCNLISEGAANESSLLSTYVTKSKDDLPAAMIKADR